jgi:type II secretory pathway component PulC
MSSKEKLLFTAGGRQVGSDDAGLSGSEAGGGSDVAAKAYRKMDGYVLAMFKSRFFNSGMFDPRALKTFNRYMTIIIVFAALYIFLDVLLVNPSRKAASAISRVSVSGTAASFARGVMPIEVKSYSHYSNMISGKSIFGVSSDAQAESQADASDSSGDSVGLVGIVSGNNPQAIVEDKKGQKTYYITKGQSVNGITVDDIGEGSVTLDYKGKKMTLSL